MKKFVMGVVLSMCAAFARADAPSGVVIETGGDEPWFEQSGVTYQGQPAWQSGDLAQVKPVEWSACSWITLTVQGPCTVSFQLGFDTMADGYSSLCAYLDGEYVALSQAWGMSRMSWTQNVFAIPTAGEHVIEIRTEYSPEWTTSGPKDFWIADIQRVDAPSSVTIDFDANGGYCSTASRTYQTGRTYGSLPTPTRAVGTFEGWYTQPIAGERVDAEDFVRFDVTTLYARWGMPIEEALGVDDNVTIEVEGDWRTGEPVWYGNVDHSHDGEGCATAGGRDSSSRRFTVSMYGPGTLSFLARPVNGDLNVGLVREEEYGYRTETLAYVGSSFGVYAYTVTGAVARTAIVDGWVRFDVDLYQPTNTLAISFYDNAMMSGAFPHGLVDEMNWTPHTAPAIVTFEYAKGSFLASRTYKPGDTYGSLPTPPSRTGYVFGGWCADSEMSNAVSEGDYVPFAGAHLYAKWKKTLALKNEGWFEGELTYTTKEKVYQSDFTPGVHYSWIEFEVPDAGFFSFWMSASNYRQCEIYVDGVLQKMKYVGSSYYGQIGFSDWWRYNLTITGSGRHTVRFVAMTFAYRDGEELVWEDMPGTIRLKDQGFEKYGQQATFGAWTDKTRNYSCWVTDNLPTLQSKYKGDKTPKGRVLYALTTLLQEGESASLQSLVKSFGITFDYMRMRHQGDVDYTNAASVNKIADTLTPECETRIKTALASLDEIPDGFSPVAITTEDCAYIDDAISLDTGDVLYMKAGLKSLLAVAHLIRAYNADVDYKQAVADSSSAKPPRVSNEKALLSKDGWQSVAWLVPCSSGRYGRAAYKAATAGNAAYFYVPGAEPASVYVSLENQQTHGSTNVNYYAYWPEMSQLECVAVFDDAAVYRCDLTNMSSLTWKTLGVSKISSYASGASSYWRYGSVAAERFLLHQTTVADKIRNATELKTAKTAVTEALQVWKRADDYVVNRTDNGLHLIEYDGHNEEATRCLQAMRRNLPKALASLSNGSTQSYEWLDLLMSEKTQEKFGGTFAEPLPMNINKVFEGALTRKVLPPSVSTDYFVPDMDELEPTLGGFMPGTTRTQWTKFLDAAKIEHSGATPTVFNYVDNGDDTITLTGVQGSAPKGAFTIPAEYDSKVVAGVGEKFLEKTTGITTLTIEEGVSFLGREAFHDISTLTSVSLPSTLVEVNEKAFCDCPKLATIKMPVASDYVGVVNGVLCDFGQELLVVAESGITSLKLPAGITRIGKQAFAGHTLLVEADLSASDLETMAKNAFAGCTALTTVRFPASFVSADEEPFLFCAKLKEVYFLGTEPSVYDSFYWLEEDNPSRLVPATTFVKTGMGWDAVVRTGVWCGRPIAYTDANPYLSIGFCTGSEDLGTISGGDKKFKALSTVKLTAKADKGYVFAGWFYDAEGTMPAEGDTDYRATSFQFTIGYDDLDLYAKFLPVSGDYCGDITIEDEESVPQGLIGVASGSLPTVTVTGLPAGLTYDKKTGELVFNEKKMKDGSYAFTISAKNTSGYKNDRVVTFVYGEAEELETRYAFTVGQTVEQPVAGNVTGLPTGLKCVKATVSGETTYTISGTPTKVGRFTAKETLPDKSFEEYYILINGAPSKYIAVSDDDLPPGCKATGSGVVSAGGKATLKATAAKGYVFAGWYADPDFSEPVVSDVDYRNPSLTITDVSTAYDTYYPRFILLQEDFIGEIWLESEGGVPQGMIGVESASLPTITVTGLPAGLTFDKKTNRLVFNESKMKPGDYVFIVSAKNTGGYKNDRVVTFQYEYEPVIDPWPMGDYALGQIVQEGGVPEPEEEMEDISLSIKGLPTGLSLVNMGDYYCITGTPTKPGRYTVTCTFKGILVESGVLVTLQKAYYMIVQGAPSRYIEVKVDDEAPAGCKVTGSGVYAAGASVKTSATAAKNTVFVGWYAENEEGKLEPFDNVYAELQGKDGDYRTASQTWLCGYYDECPTIPSTLIARFIDKSEDAIGDITITTLEEEEKRVFEANEAWDVYIDEVRNAAFADPEGVTSSGISITVDSVTVPKLTVKGSVAGLTVKNYGSYAVLYYDPNGKTMPKPGEYTVTVTAENQSKQAAMPRTLVIRVPNVVADAEVIYPYYGPEGAFTTEQGTPYTVGEYVDLDETAVFGEAPSGVERSITVKNLPAGVSYKDGYFTGAPTKAGLNVVTVSVKYRYEGEKTWLTTEATVFFRVLELDPSVVGTFNGGTTDDYGASGTISATVSAAGKLTSCKLIDRNGKSTSVALKTQTFSNEGDFYTIEGADAKGVAYCFELYPAYTEEGSETLTLSGCLYAELNDGAQWVENEYVRQNVWGDKTYKTLGMLPSFPSKGVAVEYEEDDLKLVFKSTGDVTATRGRKSGSARFELGTYSETNGWLGCMTVNVPDGDEGYCRTFEVAVSADSSEITVTPVN